jgi:hypothetical protein
MPTRALRFFELFLMYGLTGWGSLAFAGAAK